MFSHKLETVGYVFSVLQGGNFPQSTDTWELILQSSTCSKGFPGGSAGKESACNAGDLGSIPGLRRSPGEGKGYPLQCSGLENSWTVQSMGPQRVRHDWVTFTNRFYIRWGQTVPILIDINCQSAVTSFSSSVNIHWVSTEQKLRKIYDKSLYFIWWICHQRT